MRGLSRAQFFRAFRQPTWLSPHRYLAKLRIDQAQTLLDETDMDIAQIGASVGLGDQARFSALFKARFGVSPRLYRLSRS